MTNTKVLVCVTQQRSCSQLITHGQKLVEKVGGDLFVIHIVKKGWKYMGNLSEPDALDYLFEVSKTFGAELIVRKASDIEFALKETIEKNDIDVVIMGKSSESNASQNMINRLKDILDKDIALNVISTVNKDV